MTWSWFRLLYPKQLQYTISQTEINNKACAWAFTKSFMYDAAYCNALPIKAKVLIGEVLQYVLLKKLQTEYFYPLFY